jgi:hypothetical protein
VQALSRRCAAIRSAIERYNALAPLQKPPRPSLAYSDVVDYCNFSEFEILKHSDHELLSKPWAVSSNRQAANKYFKVERAKEEIRRCNVEVARLQAWVDADDSDISKAVSAYDSTDPAFAAHLRIVQAQSRRTNDQLRMRLQQIYSLPGYSGSRPPAPTSSVAPVLSTNPSCSNALFLATPVVPTIGEEDSTEGNDSDEEEQEGLHAEGDEDEILRFTDTLTRIIQ